MHERHLSSLQREQGRAFARKSFIQADSLRVLFDYEIVFTPLLFVQIFCFVFTQKYISIASCLFKNVQKIYRFTEVCVRVYFFKSFKGLCRAQWC